MTDYLTQENGVVCRDCFKTINLTKTNWKPKPRWFQYVELFTGKDNAIRIRCPYCNNRAFYDYQKDVKPILNTDQIQKDEYEEKLKKVKEGAKIIVNELISQTPNPELDNDQDQIEPKTPPKSKDRSGVF